MEFYSHAFEAGHSVMMVLTADRQQEVYALLRRDGGYDFSTRAPQTMSLTSPASPDSAGESKRKRHEEQVTAAPHKTA